VLGDFFPANKFVVRLLQSYDNFYLVLLAQILKYQCVKYRFVYQSQSRKQDRVCDN